MISLTPEEKEALAEISKKKGSLIQQHGIKKSTAESRPTVPRKYTTERMGRQLSALGSRLSDWVWIPHWQLPRVCSGSISRGLKRGQVT